MTPSAAAVATAASAALPPFARMSIPIWLASRSTEETAPPEPTMSGTLGRSVGGLPCHPLSATAGVAVTRASDGDGAEAEDDPAAVAAHRSTVSLGDGCVRVEMFWVLTKDC